jgi:uncharacterized protein with ATP-grasp and redox domains
MNQTLKSAKLLEADDATAKRMLDETARILMRYDLNATPPEIAKDTYAAVARISGEEDPIARAKEAATKAALRVDTSKIRTLHDALKFALVGNVIDFGAQRELDMDETIRRAFAETFAVDDFSQFEKELAAAETLVYIGDNTGEHIFDKVFIQAIKQRYDVEVYYFVRGKPIINDVTVKEGAYLADVASIVDTGVPTPGFDLRFANEASKRLFQRADIVLSKGMGNFESLYDVCGRTVYYLFVVKCDVVSNAIGYPVGSLIFTKH